MKTPSQILSYRKEQCRLCPNPCEHQSNVEWLSEGSNGCPINRFMVWESFKRVSVAPVVQQEPIAPVSVDQDGLVEVSTKTSFGLGDMVAAIAEPIAKASDAVFKTKLKGCSACRKRREMLNTLMPFYKI
jgi:hypothetical protein